MSYADARSRFRYVNGRSVGTWVVLAAGAVFWGYLLLRWFINWGWLPFGTPGEPLFDPAALGLSGGAATAVGSLPRLAEGAYITVVITVVAILLGLVLAVPLSVARVYGRWTKALSLSFTELIRGTPLIAQLYLLYYGLNLSQYFRGLTSLGPFVLDTALWVALIGFTINSAAYQAEYIRAAIESVDPQQLVAARSIGLTQQEGIRHVVLPQTLRFAIPGWTNELVYLIKYSSLATFITVAELFRRGDAIASDTFDYTAMFTVVAVVYIGIVITATRLMGYFEDRVALPGLGSVEGR
ncbi:amino acid ABC transporter permease [Haloarchaeobius sp. HRN-SO-5]|uniref:amino acid ABC transporter permease n=1 Tax=Haloarchaeobius sp. HRN-SO-5 TaxID=3446118 RepID=UPI003EBD1E23